jgi:hypothetical protein
MKQLYEKQEIAQLLSKFMAGETSVAEEEVLAQYFRTHEVDEEWAEYKEMFTLFDNGEVDIEPGIQNVQRSMFNVQREKLPKQPKAVREKPKIVTLRWLMVGIAASIVLLVAFHLGRSTIEQSSLVAEKSEISKEDSQPKHETIAPTEKTEEAIVAQAIPAKPQISKLTSSSTGDSASASEGLANCIARLEAEMEKLDDSVSSAQVERLIAADARLQQMVNRIVGKQVEQALNELKNDSTANYINF